MPKINDLLITSNSPSFDVLENWCAMRAIKLTRQSQITTLPILGIDIPKTDWIFFSSPQSATLYLKHYSIKALKIGVFGAGTEDVLIKNGIKPNFCGVAHERPSEIGKALAKRLSTNETILFPLSNRSNRSISKEIHADQRYERITYRTEFTPQHYSISPAAILFTSPSNYESYTQLNLIDNNTWVIAIGQTTARFIKGKHENVYELDEPNAQALISFLETIH